MTKGADLRAAATPLEYGLGRGVAVVVGSLVVAGAVLLALDLAFLGVIAKPFYDEALGPLRATEVHWPAALSFYAFYLAVVVGVGASPAASTGEAAWRGAGLGLFAYTVYELTNWAVLANWPARLVPVDIAWGVFLTGAVAAASYAVSAALRPKGVLDWWEPLPIQYLPGERPHHVWLRRALSIPLILTLSVVGWLASPLWLLIAVAADIAVGPRWRWPRARSVGFFLVYLGCEIIGIFAAAGIWLVTGGGRIVSHGRYLEYNRRLQGWWGSTLMKGAFAVYSMRLHSEGLDVASKGPFILWIRHVSTADTVLGATLIATPNRLLLQYVLKRELLWDPCLDIVARRLPNVFVDRSEHARQGVVDAVAQLGRDLGEGSAVLLYPEGTRFSVRRRDAAVARLRERGDTELLERAQRMRAVVPPQLRGALALMDSAPGVDIVVMAHTGLEGAASFPEFFRGGLIGSDVHVKVWRIPGSDIPADGRDVWLYDRWLEVDDWVEKTSNAAHADDRTCPPLLEPGTLDET